MKDMPNFTLQNDQQFAEKLFRLATILVSLGVCAFAVDLTVGWAFLGEAGPIWTEGRDIIRKLVKPAETFGNGLGALLILAVLFAADHAHRRGLWRMAIVIYGAGIAANVGKLLVARSRPKVFFDAESGVFLGSVTDSFHGWLPLAGLGYSGQSFPSGHTAVAAALAIALCHRWPRARWAFIGLALMTIMQRIAYGRHYPSDCFFGAALACLVAAICFHPRLLGTRFARFGCSAPNAASRPSRLHESASSLP